MKHVTNVVVAAMFASALGGPANANAADLILVSVDGTKQGKIKGDSTLKNQEQKINALSYSYVVSTPTDAASGQATGKLQHDAVKIKKVLGPASPQLFNALVSNEHLKEVQIEIFRTDSKGVSKIAFSIKLTDARVAKINHEETSAKASATTAKASGTGQGTEEIWFSFSTIEIRDVTTDTVAAASATGDTR